MPKTYLTKEQRIKERFSDWIYMQLRHNKMTQEQLGERIGMTQSALNHRLKKHNFSFGDFIIITDFFRASAEDVVWITGMKGE